MTTRKRNKRWVYVYLNNEADYADCIYTAWPFNRVLAHFKRKFTNYDSIEVKVSDMDAGLGMVYVKENKPLPIFCVLYRDTTLLPLDCPLGFLCNAVDSDHAEEQCNNAYPDCDVVWVVEAVSVKDALNDYWGAKHV